MWFGSAITFDPEVPTTIYFGAVNGAGIFRSLDSGITWSNLRHNSPTNIAVDPYDSRHILAAALDEGLIESHDAGNTWINVSSALPPLPSNNDQATIDGINFHPYKQGAIFISTTSSMVEPGEGLIRSLDGGVTYQTANTGLPFWFMGGSMAFNPKDPNVLLIGGYDAQWDGELAKSTDGGNSWAATRSPEVGPFSIDSRSNPPVVYGTNSKSSDFGDNWMTLNMGPPLLADPSAAGSIFSLNSWSSDAGFTWQPLLKNGLGQAAISYGGLETYFEDGTIIAPGSPQVMFVTSNTNGLFRFVVGP
jgi:hypothetical protein